MFLKFKKLLKSKNFYKKLGQSFTEYAIILGLLGLVIGFGTKELYDASKHNFYYGLLPTNQQNIDLPTGPAGQQGFFQEAYLGKISLVCEVEQKVEKTDENGNKYFEYYVEAGQTIYCYDNSINASRNNWSSKYKEFTLSYGAEEKVNLSIWDEYGIRYSTYAVIKTLERADGEGGNFTKPIANLIINPESKRYSIGDIINASAAGSLGLNRDSASIDEYEWKISDIYMGYENEGDEKKKKLIKVDPLPGTQSSQNVTIKVLGESEIEDRARGTTTEISNSPSGTRYIRLRVRSGDVWSDWTQKPLYAAINSKPIAYITSNFETSDEKLNVIANQSFKVFNNKSYDPDFVAFNGMVDLETSKEYYNNNKYEVNTDLQTWTKAQEECVKKGAHLATISSREENDLITDLLADAGVTSKYSYIGGTDASEEGTWELVSGETFTAFLNWGTAKPNQEKETDDYLAIYLNSSVADRVGAGQWDDVDGTTPAPYVCEYENAITTTLANGIVTFQWRLYTKVNGTYELTKEYGLNEDIVDSDGFIFFNNVGEYCLTLRVEDEEGYWSDWPDPNNPAINPNKMAYKYISVKKENLAPKLELTSSPLPVDGEIKGTIATEYEFTPTIIHPEIENDPDNYQELYMPTDYQFGYFTWVVKRPDGSVFDEGENHTTDPIKLAKLGISGEFTIEIKVCDASGKWSDLIVYNIKVIFATKYSTIVTREDNVTGSAVPSIPPGMGTDVPIYGDDKSYSEIYGSGNYVDMGFNFLAYGISFRYVDFSTNGLITFASGYDEANDPQHTNLINYSHAKGSGFYNNENYGMSGLTEYTLAAYWDDLYFGHDSAALEYWVDNDNQRVIIEYKNLGNFNPSSSYHDKTDFNMTVVISAAGYIDVYYISSDWGASSYDYGKSATIGIKGKGNEYVTYSAYGEVNIPNGTKLTFTPVE